MNPAGVLLVVVGYLLGSLSFAVLVVRWKTGKDIRSEGSGNAGATNVLRGHGKALAAIVAAADVGKGAAAVLLMRLATADPRYAAAAGVAAVLGHVFPIFYGFRGGKGVATAVGAFLALCPVAMLVDLGVFALVVVLTRYVSLGSCLAIVVLPPLAGVFHAPRAAIAAAAVVAVIVVWKHRENLERLAKGEERKLGRR